MVDVIADAEMDLLRLETEIKNFKADFEAKTSERVFSNHTWITLRIEEKLLKKAKRLKEKLENVKKMYANEFPRSSLQFSAPIEHCDIIITSINDVAQVYKMRLGLMDIKMRLNHSLPIIVNNMTHLRNRFYIIKGNVNRGVKLTEEDIFR